MSADRPDHMTYSDLFDARDDLLALVAERADRSRMTREYAMRVQADPDDLRALSALAKMAAVWRRAAGDTDGDDHWSTVAAAAARRETALDRLSRQVTALALERVEAEDFDNDFDGLERGWVDQALRRAWSAHPEIPDTDVRSAVAELDDES